MKRTRTLLQLFTAFSNPNRVKIYKLCLKKPSNISEIGKELNLNYKTAFDNIKILQEANLVKKKIKTRKGTSREALITSIPMSRDYIGFKILKELEKQNLSTSEK
jgi:predicted transcriptional regulator